MNNHSSFVFKNKIFRKEAFLKYQKLMENDGRSQDDLYKLNWNKRKEIVNHAYNMIPFYKNHYDSYGFKPSFLKKEEDWNKVPIISKGMIRDNFNDLINPSLNSDRHQISSTGGTTGVPLKVIHDKKAYLEVNSWRIMKWWGLPLGPNIAFVFRLTQRSRLENIVNKLMWFPTKRVFLDASSISPDNIKPFVDKLVKNNTQVLQGYTGALNEVAIYLINNNIQVNCLKAIWCTSSPLTGNIRINLRKAFNADIYDQYGSGEVYWIATECTMHNGLHIHSDLRHIDIVDEEEKNLGKGRLGHIIVT
ncbi:MAG: hypothetical protein WD555_02625, partial [Fulvivirga sp.]